MRITKKMLQECRACEEQVERFEKLFPEGAEVNEENLELALKARLDFYWAGKNLLPREARLEFKRAVEVASEVLKEGIAPLQEELRAAEVFAKQKKEFREEITLAREVYYQRTTPVFEAYDKTKGTVFVKLWRKYMS